MRRAATFTVATVAFVSVWLTLPLLVLAALTVDALSKGRSARCRTVLFMATLLACEVIGLFAALALWLASGRWLGLNHRWFVRANVDLQRWFTGTLFRAALLFYSMKLEVEGLDVAREGPYFLFVRHASTADTVLPAAVVANHFGIVMRYVLKRELLWDPCLDVVGNRLSNVFVDRSGIDSEREQAAVSKLARNLGERDAVLIYPEGTRFTPTKRERILARLELSASPAVLSRAESLRNVLPPRKGGPFALLDASPETDVVFLAHSGLEGAVSLPKLVRAGLVGQTIRVKLWRVPAAAIPKPSEARLDWLLSEWAKVDDWVTAGQKTARAEQAA